MPLDKIKNELIMCGQIVTYQHLKPFLYLVNFYHIGSSLWETKPLPLDQSKIAKFSFFQYLWQLWHK